MNDGALATVFKGLADFSRLRILNLLFQGELCGCDIQYALKLSQSNISRHLKYLKNCGLVLDRRAGFRIYYRLASAKSSDHKVLFDYLEHAFDSNDTLKDDLNRLRDAVKEGSCTLSDPQLRKTATSRHRGQTLHRAISP